MSEDMNKEVENMPLATELLHEVRLQAKRWFIAFCIMVVVECATIGAFMWYISLPIEDNVVTQTTEGEGHTVVGIGDNYGKTDSTAEKESGTGSENIEETGEQ